MNIFNFGRNHVGTSPVPYIGCFNTGICILAKNKFIEGAVR
jgi:hypothetical protein